MESEQGHNQAKGITESAYVTQCRAGQSASQPKATPPAPSAAAKSPATSTQKTVKACQDEWRANRAAYQTAKITQQAYVTKCRAGETVALPNPSPPTEQTPASAPAPAARSNAPAPAATTAAPPPQSPAASRQTSTTAQPAPQSAGQFQTEALAKAHCPADVVVWGNLPTKVYHFAGYKSYGGTKRGAYMCEKEATAQGFRASKTEKRPGA